VNNKFEMIFKEAAVTCCEVVSGHLLEVTKENHGCFETAENASKLKKKHFALQKQLQDCQTSSSATLGDIIKGSSFSITHCYSLTVSARIPLHKLIAAKLI